MFRKTRLNFSSPQHFNIPRHDGPLKRSLTGNSMMHIVKHYHRKIWWRVNKFSKRPFMINYHFHEPRFLLQRDIIGDVEWSYKNNFPDKSRWETCINGQRVMEDRYIYVEEGGIRYKVNWILYSQRLQKEMKALIDNSPQYTYELKAVPIGWKKMDISCQVLQGMSVREAMAQGKLSCFKGHQVIYHILNLAQQGAENKGLDKEKLRIVYLTCFQGPVDKQIDIRSKGFYAWKTKKSTNVVVCVAEDPDLVLPDRTALPYSSLIAIKKAGLYDEPVFIDVPAITSDEI